MQMNIASNELIHFVGIGGIGMSGLAQIMFNMGFQIQGSDLNQNKNIICRVSSCWNFQCIIIFHQSISLFGLPANVQQIYSQIIVPNEMF